MIKIKKFKLLSVVFIIIILILMGTKVFGTTVGDMEPQGIDADKIVTGSDTFTNVGADVVGIIRAVGIVLSVAILSVLGIKYMMGSSEERAEYKKSMLPYLIGAIILFAASNLAEIIYQFATGVKASITAEKKEESNPTRW